LEDVDQARVRSYITSGNKSGAGGRKAFSRAKGEWRVAFDAAKARLADEQRAFTPELDWDDAVSLPSRHAQVTCTAPLFRSLLPSPSHPHSATTQMELDAQKFVSGENEYEVCTPLWHLSPSPSVLSLSLMSCSLSLSHAPCLLASKFCHHADGTCC
jgi:hypothetical protein